MTYDKRFYGIYEGICIDNQDPDKKGRIKLQVPQVTGLDVTEWARPIGGGISQVNFPYGTFSSNATQTVTAANTATIANFGVTEDSNRTALVDNTKITAYESGDYFFQFSAQFAKSGGSSAQADIWLRKNGVDLPRTTSRVTLQGNPNEVLITLNYILDLDANDYIQIVFSSADNTVYLHNITGLTSPTRPDVPGIIATLNLVGKYVPKPGDPVWVSFIGGDPNFPVWMGAQA